MSELYEKIEHYAELLLSPTEIAILLDQDVKRFCYEAKKVGSNTHLAYQKGRLKTKIALRSNVIELMKKRSPQAELLVNEFLKNNE